jgi:hypothetical protein
MSNFDPNKRVDNVDNPQGRQRHEKDVGALQGEEKLWGTIP